MIRTIEIIDKKCHSHFSSEFACHKLIETILEGYVPQSRYFRKAAERILTDEEYESLREDNHKEPYHNKIKKLRQQRRVYKYR